MKEDKSFQQALEENIKGITESEFFCDFYSENMADFKSDPWPAIQLAIAILLDKPIILAVPNGRKPPSKLLAIADVVIEGGPEELVQGIAKFVKSRDL